MQPAIEPASLVRCEDRAPGVRWLILDQPQRRNALSGAMIAALQAALDAAAEDQAARVLVIAAAGPVFSAGHDLRELRALAGEQSADAPAERCLPVFVDCSRMMTTIVRLPKPVIACVQGLATAAGCQLVASCDLVVAAASAA
ncbi:MAG TPA: enoyl-CoA hydratase-related protein, partial [Thermoanaerobaculia bacterium]|nr:enoyl-CoA hydratase-related protein [Thermoanaerobaculia bacterium]